MPELGDRLSEREIELLELVATGVTNREIAYRLHISVNTVKVHVRNIFTKIGAESRTEATMIAVREGLINVAGVELPNDQAAATPAAEPEPESAPPRPLTWAKRIALLSAPVLVAGLITVTWPNRGASQVNGNTDLPPERSQEQNVNAQVQNPTSRWHDRAQMPTPRAYLAAAAVEHRIYAIGGRAASGLTSAVEVYDPVDDIWARGSDKPTPVAYVSAAALDRALYVPGGCNAEFEPTRVMEVYDTAADVWREAAPLPAARCAYALGADADAFYVVGGRDRSRYVASVYAYDPQADSWTEMAPMPTARGFASASVLDGRIYVVGGYDGNRELTTCEVFDPARNAWAECAPLTVGRGSVATATLADHIYAVGGGGWTSYLGFNEGYNPQTDTWSPVETPLIGEWRSPGLVVLDTRIYAIGGWSGRYLSLNQVYEALPFRLFIPGSQQN
ncbi:MAG: hypothetical protein GX601_06660 [Anaerolineales bacterium]|nr:hypothetical protein [Anaerolineales bacterium]